MVKGFKKDGKFRPTEGKRKSPLSSSIKCGICGNSVLRGNHDHISVSGNDFIKRKKQSMDNQKITDEVELVNDFGNDYEEKFWKIKGLTSNPEVDGKTIPVEFYVKTINLKEFNDDYDEETSDDEYYATLVIVPKKFGKKTKERIQKDSGLPDDEPYTIYDVLQGEYYIDVRDEEGETEAEAINELVKNSGADAGLIGFVLDRYINGIGETGWDKLSEIALDKPKPTFDELMKRRKE